MLLVMLEFIGKKRSNEKIEYNDQNCDCCRVSRSSVRVHIVHVRYSLYNYSGS